MKTAARLLITMITLAAAHAAWPQSGYPAKPVRVVIGFPPASAADIVARVVGARMSDGLNLLVVHPSLPVRSVQELIKTAKAKPGEILYGSSGNGTGPHLSGELFNLMAGVKLVHIPYKGSPQAMTDLLGGRVMAMFSPASTALPHIKAGTLRALAASTAQRTSAAPDLPTIAKSGLPGFETSVWFGLLAPAATPRDNVDRLNREIARALAEPEVKKQFAAQGIDAMGGTPEQFTSYIRDETAKWARVVKASGAKLD